MLFRDAEALETLRIADTLVVDKAGTLTEGKPKLVVVEAMAGWTEGDLLAAAAGLERGSEHPLASAIVHGAQDRGVIPTDVQNFQSVTGKGVRAQARGDASPLATQRWWPRKGSTLLRSSLGSSN